ncbi:hypothetical protein TI39_contig338g00004 [Zymoseptoria brevis]|uniref:Uncharacterized protein n=1 Tax=Zymoseptoria brevis TaxID=1047168 RepID=A0A0F4GT79_9PEZI|nr:hypothetical protein TI39_contig338g00004 [Zymoseptoria brevis]
MSQKRKRDNDASALSAAQDQFRTWLIKNTSDAVEYIKKDFLSEKNLNTKEKSWFGKALSAHPRFESKDDKNGIVFQFKPVIPAANAEVARLQASHCGRPAGRMANLRARDRSTGARASHSLDDDFQDLWSGIKVPEDIEEIRKDLKATNMMVTSEKKAAPVVRSKKSNKGGRRAGKGIQTNKHMESVLKNYGKK